MTDPLAAARRILELDGRATPPPWSVRDDEEFDAGVACVIYTPAYEVAWSVEPCCSAFIAESRILAPLVARALLEQQERESELVEVLSLFDAAYSQTLERRAAGEFRGDPFSDTIKLYVSESVCRRVRKMFGEHAPPAPEPGEKGK